MCLVLLGLGAMPLGGLVMAGNRDEQRKRPWLPPHRVVSSPDVWGGKDLEAGGCWMAMNSSGTMAALTNHHQAKGTLEKNPLSRGHIVLDVLRQGTLKQGLKWLARQPVQRYRPFHLALGNAHELWCFSTENPISIALEAGRLWAMSNGGFGELPWPKVTCAQAFGQQAATLAPNAWWQALQQFLCQVNPLVVDGGSGMDSMQQVYVTGPTYGTVCSTLMTHASALGTRCAFAPSTAMDTARQRWQQRGQWQSPYQETLPSTFIRT